MPTNPVSSLILRVDLGVAHLLNQLIVDGPVILLAEELRHDDHIIVLDLASKLRSIRSDHDSHFRSHKSALGVERLSVTAGTSLFLGFSLLLGVKQPRIIIDSRQVGIIELCPERLFGFHN